MLNFITNTKAIEGALEYISNPIAVDYNEDFANGLDGILTDKDKRFMQYAKKYGPIEEDH